MPTRSVAIGSSVLTVGVPGGTLIMGASGEPAEARELERALADEEPDRRTIGELTEGAVTTASEATDRVEQAVDLLSDALAGRLVDLDRAGQVLDVLQRLDQDDRYEDWLRYARSVHGVLVLGKRWAEILGLLRTLLRSGDEVHRAGRAWAQHELGTLQLAAGDPAEAARLLERARATRQELGDAEGLAATEHGLGVLCRRQAEARGNRRPRRLVLLAVALLLLVAGGVAGAVADPFEPEPEEQAVKDGPGEFALTVTRSGEGRVTSRPDGIDCGDDCDQPFTDGTEVELIQEGAVFAGWGGACSGTEGCRVTMTQARTVTAAFEQAPPTRFVLTTTTSGTGELIPQCSQGCEYDEDTPVTLTATPAGESNRAEWTGCTPEEPGATICEVTMSEDRAVSVRFFFAETEIP